MKTRRSSLRPGMTGPLRSPMAGTLVHAMQTPPIAANTTTKINKSAAPISSPQAPFRSMGGGVRTDKKR